VNIRNRTPSEYIYCAPCFYFSILSLRRTSQRLSYFIKRNHGFIWNWIQKYNPQKISSKKKKVSKYSRIQKDEKVMLFHLIQKSKTLAFFVLKLQRDFNAYKHKFHKSCFILFSNYLLRFT
jgi:hypothetical protein